MKNIAKRVLALLLCAALLCGFAAAAPSNAQQPQADETQSASLEEHVVYGKAGETTFVPAGYTYVFEQENGETITQTNNVDTYVYQRILTAEEAQQLAALQSNQAGYTVDADGQTLLCKEFDAAEALSYSEKVKSILGLEDVREVEEGAKVQVLCEAYGPATPVRAMITFEDQPVIRMEGMSVSLGTGLGETELQAARSIQNRQLIAMTKAERKLGYEIPILDQFSLLTNAVAATVRYGDLAAIAQMDGVKSAILMPTYEVPDVDAQILGEDFTLEPNMKYAGPGMGANGAWDVGYRGEGMSVAIIDTGTSLTNPAFEIEPTDPDAVAFTREDVEAILAAKDLHAEALSEDTSIDTVYYNSKIPFGFSYASRSADFGEDSNYQGHGSHVAGIVAGNIPEGVQDLVDMDTLGIAPEAQLISMNVFGSNGGAYMDDVVAALEDTILLGVDCANLSLGSPCGPAYFEDVTEVYQAAYDAGINVVVAAGNEAHTGYNSLWGDNLVKSDSVSTGTVGMPGTFDSVLTVASVENSHSFHNGNTISWYNQGTGSQVFIEYGELPDVPAGKGFRENLKGREFAYTDSFRNAEGKLVFYKFEGGNADGIIAEAAKAGAAGLLLTFLDGDAEFSATCYDVPTAITSLAAYEAIQKAAGETLYVDDTWNPSATAGEISYFSSWGPTGSLTLKPEITGIGGNVFSAYYGDYFAVASGTSMASPAVAASAALLRQYLREKKLVAEEDLAYVVNCLLMSTATPVFDEEHGTYYFVRQQGAGLANIAAAISSGAYITVEGTNKAKLELGDDPERTGVYDMTFEVVNFSDSSKTYTLDTTVLGQKANGGQMKYGEVTYLTYDYAREMESTVTTSLEQDTVTVPAGGKVKITVTVALTEAEKAYYDERFPAGAYVEGFIQLLSSETPNLVVPFLGFYGDFSDGPILEPHGCETILAGAEKGFSASDQFNGGLWGTTYRMEFGKAGAYEEKHYLGDTDMPGYVKIPAEYYDRATMDKWATPFVKETAGFSPNGDGRLETFNLGFALRRNAENIHYTVTNKLTGEILWEEDTGFVQKTYTADAYAGRELYLGWLYKATPLNGSYYYDTDTVLLENNTWVEIRADVTPEGQTKATETVSFPVYVDNDAPDTHYTVRHDGTYYQFRRDLTEKWFCDYSLDVLLQFSSIYNRPYGTFMYVAYVNGSGTPGTATDSWLQLGSTMDNEYFSEHRYIHFASDYACNTTGVDISWGNEELLNYIDLSPEKSELMVGDIVTIENVATMPENTVMVMNWSLSDPTLAEIVETTDHSVTIRGLARGNVTVYGGYGEIMKPIELQVKDPAFEALRTRFVDVPGHWAEEDILEAVWRGLLEGTSANTFSPNEALTRAQLVTVLYRMAGSPEAPEASNFNDVPAGTWFSDAVAWGQSSGIVKGMTEDTFGPGIPTSRQQLATFLYRYAEAMGQDVSARADLTAYTDAGAIQPYAVDAVCWAVAEGLIRGVSNTTLRPNDTATRAQAAAILIRYLTK